MKKIDASTKGGDTIIHTAFDIEHKYRKRSCLNCEKWETCRSGKHRPLGLICDYGKFGGVRYHGEFITEKQMTYIDKK